MVRVTRAPCPVTLTAMTVLTAGNTVYTSRMAKVMISVPDDLLERLDAQAKRNGETRSGFLRRLVERELDVGRVRRQQHFEDLLAKAKLPMGGESARLIREDRESH